MIALDTNILVHARRADASLHGKAKAVLKELALSGNVCGALVRDARIAACCRIHAVQELWTADRDFSRFPSLKTRNPLA